MFVDMRGGSDDVVVVAQAVTTVVPRMQATGLPWHTGGRIGSRMGTESVASGIGKGVSEWSFGDMICI